MRSKLERRKGLAKLLLLSSAPVALLLSASAAWADCTPVNTSTDPHSVTCSGSSSVYYDDTTQPVQGDVEVTMLSGAFTNAAGAIVIGSTDNLAALKTLAGSSMFSQFGYATNVRATGLGTARIDNSGSANGRYRGLNAAADATGRVEITNQASGNVRVNSIVAEAGIYATGGDVAVTNFGSISATSTGFSQVSGIFANSTSSTGAVEVSNFSAISVAGGSSFGILAQGGATATVTNSVSGLSAGTIDMAYSAGRAYGIKIKDVSGLASLNSVGGKLTMGGSGIAVSVESGSADLQFGDAVIGSTVVSGDISVHGNIGVETIGQTGSVNIGFLGASVSVVDGYRAVGISVDGGSDITITTAINTITGSRASISVDGSNPAGVAVSGATGTVSVNLGDTLTVYSGVSDATGLIIDSGASADITLADVTVTGISSYIGGSNATVVSVSGVSGAVSGHINQTLTANSPAANAAVFLVHDVGAFSLEGAGEIRATGGVDAIGVETYAVAGDQSVDIGDLYLSASNGRAVGVSLSGAGAISIDTGVVDLARAATSGYGLQATTTGATSDIAITSQGLYTDGPNVDAISATAGAAGDVSIAVGFIEATGQAGRGVVTSTGSGATSIVNLGQISTTGADSQAVLVTSASGDVDVTSQTVVTTGARSVGVSLTTGGAGDLSLSSHTAQVGGASADAIQLVAGTGTTTVVLQAGGLTSSAGGDALSIQSGGTATIDIGAGAVVTAGGGWGVTAAASGGAVLNNAGSISGSGGQGVSLTGGASTINNDGSISGAVQLSAGTDLFVNDGVWNASGASAFGGGADRVESSGAIYVAPTAASATTVTFGGLETLVNSGLISLSQSGSAAHSGDVLDLGSASYSGVGARLFLDVNLSGTAVGGSPAASADTLVTTGAASGSTTIVLNDVSGGAGSPALGAIALVRTGSAAAGAFTLQGGSFRRGIVLYDFISTDGDYYLFGRPDDPVFEVGRVGGLATRHWRQGADSWSEEMREAAPQEAGSTRVWLRASGGDLDQSDRPVFAVAGVDGLSIAPDLSSSTRSQGLQGGVQFARQSYMVGLTAGYVGQRSRFDANGDTLRLRGYNIGAYGRAPLGALSLSALLNYDSYKVEASIDGGALADKFDGSSWGGAVQVDYRRGFGKLLVQPLASLSWAKADLSDLEAAGVVVRFEDAKTLYGVAGLRAGLELGQGAVRWRPYVGGYVEKDFADAGRSVLVSGVSEWPIEDRRGGASGRFEAGFVAISGGWRLGGMVSSRSGSGMSGVSGAVDLSWRW